MRLIRNFGYFGKGVVAPPPAAPAQADISPSPVSVAVQTPIARPMQATPLIQPMQQIVQPMQQAVQPMKPAQAATSAAQPSEVELRLQELREEVEAKKFAKDEEVRQVKETHWRQANYGRDVVQDRPDRAGYATESEKLMGGRTGYYNKPILATETDISGWSGLGAADLNQVATELEAAAKDVKQVSVDVKAGVLPKSDLVRAIQVLEAKTKEANRLKKQLSGFGDATNILPWTAGALLVLLIGLYLAHRGV